MYHTAILVNEKTGRFHPMPFRPAPLPSENPELGEVCRHKSIGHHTVGFAAMEEAVAHIKADDNYWPSYEILGWDGDSTPASISYYPFNKQIEKPAATVAYI